MTLPILETAGEPDFAAALCRHGLPGLRRRAVTTLQVNVGKLCNQACHHCHVDAGPRRTEVMTPETAERVKALAEASPALRTIDITGGAPELNPSFRDLVRHFRRSRGLDLKIIDRCNLTVLAEPGQEDLAGFLATHRVHVVASLPCYSEGNVDRQRGQGVFRTSIEALRSLNRLGYGRPGSGLELDLVYNPGGPSLPPPQQALEADYKERLDEDFGVVFNRLLTLTNMPISRFAQDLRRNGRFEEYLALLASSFNAATVEAVMCRDLVSVGWDGTVYDCDFNQMLEIPAGHRGRTIWDVQSLDELTGEPIAVGSHCFGCTAGAGSSCGGALG